MIFYHLFSSVWVPVAARQHCVFKTKLASSWRSTHSNTFYNSATLSQTYQAAFYPSQPHTKVCKQPRAPFLPLKKGKGPQRWGLILHDVTCTLGQRPLYSVVYPLSTRLESENPVGVIHFSITPFDPLGKGVLPKCGYPASSLLCLLPPYITALIVRVSTVL